MVAVKKDEATACINDEDNEEEDEEEDEDSEEQVEVQMPAKGGKKVTAVVQMRGGRQVVSKK